MGGADADSYVGGAKIGATEQVGMAKMIRAEQPVYRETNKTCSAGLRVATGLSRLHGFCVFDYPRFSPRELRDYFAEVFWNLPTAIT
jgi:hypothetical protein